MINFGIGETLADVELALNSHDKSHQIRTRFTNIGCKIKSQFRKSRKMETSTKNNLIK